MRWLAVFTGGPLDGQQREIDLPEETLRAYWQRRVSALRDDERLELTTGYHRNEMDSERRVAEYVYTSWSA